MPIDTVSVSLMKFLTITTLPVDWKHFDLYLFRDDEVTFYVGQSECAFRRIWDHITGGIKGHAVVGRFILVNWPKSAHFTIEFYHSHSDRFGSVMYRLDQSERLLIETRAPCFNVSLNREPTALPAQYLPPNAPMKYLKSFRRMMREAEVASKLADARDTEWSK